MQMGVLAALVTFYFRKRRKLIRLDILSKKNSQNNRHYFTLHIICEHVHIENILMGEKLGRILSRC